VTKCVVDVTNIHKDTRDLKHTKSVLLYTYNHLFLNKKVLIV